MDRGHRIRRNESDLPSPLDDDECEESACGRLAEAQPAPLVSSSLVFNHHGSVPVGFFALDGRHLMTGDVFHIRRVPVKLHLYVQCIDSRGFSQPPQLPLFP
jgi:hypothetical protein